jgi:hypothetical protein
MSGAWDAPFSLRQQFADEDDPPPPDFVMPPQFQLPPLRDPDMELGIVHAYAGQVALLDLCLGALLDAMDDHPLGDQTLLAFSSPRGYPLGEHGQVGPADALYGELLHVPLMVRYPRTKGAPARVSDMAQPADLHRIVQSWLGNLSDAPPAVQTAGAIGQGERAIRTPAWFLRETHVGGQRLYELFAKPDDRWEVNEISSRAGEIVQLMVERLREFESAAAANNLAALPPLSASLKDLWR